MMLFSWPVSGRITQESCFYSINNNNPSHASAKANTDAASCLLIAHQTSHVFHRTSVQPASAAVLEYYKKPSSTKYRGRWVFLLVFSGLGVEHKYGSPGESFFSRMNLVETATLGTTGRVEQTQGFNHYSHWFKHYGSPGKRNNKKGKQ